MRQPRIWSKRITAITSARIVMIGTPISRKTLFPADFQKTGSLMTNP